MLLDHHDIPKGYNTANMFVLVKNSAGKFIQFVEVSWHDQKPSDIYTTLMSAMRALKSRGA